MSYNKEELELINHFITEGATNDQAIDIVHETYRNPNSPYYKMSLVDCAVEGAR